MKNENLVISRQYYVAAPGNPSLINETAVSYYNRLLLGLRNRQKELGFTNKQVAGYLGMKESSYSRFIQGRYIVSVKTLIEVCFALDMELCVLSSCFNDLEDET